MNTNTNTNTNINAIKTSLTEECISITFGNMENDKAQPICSIEVLPEDYYALMQALVKLGIEYEHEYKKNIGFSTNKN